MPPLQVKDKHLIALAIGQSIACTTQAAVITVNSTLDSVNQGANTCTLRDAINLANLEGNPPGSAVNGCSVPDNGPDTIVLPQSQTFNVATSGFNAFTLSSNITFNGNNAEINVSGVRRIFYVQTGANVTLNDITLSGGGLSGTSFLGGAMYVSGIATLNNSIVTDNGAGAGGGIYSKGGLYLNGSTVTGNSTTATTGTSGGGGILINAGNLFVTQNSRISNNQSAMSGGGIGVLSGASVALYNSTISGNTVDDGSLIFRGFGGGVFVSNAMTLDVRDSVVSDNSADIGGGLYLDDSIVNTVTITGSSIVDNSALGRGGGISTYQTAEISNSTLTGNTAGGATGPQGIGGGLFTGTGGNTFLTNSTVSGNRAATGAGIYNSRSSLVAENSTFSANVGHSPIGNNLGHEFYNGFQGLATLINSTVVGATSTSSIQSQNRLTLKNSIVVNSIGTACVSLNVEADASNIISDGSCNTNALAVDPQLMPLTDNGGPTLTHALRSNSPARNRGAVSDCPSTDQRGVERILSDGSCDIGSFEFIDDEACFVVRAADSKVVAFCL